MVKSNKKQNNKSNNTYNKIKFFTYSIVYKYKTKVKRKKKNLNKFSNFYYKCNLCGKLFPRFYRLKRHAVQVEFNLLLSCPYCNKKVKRLDEHAKFCKELLAKKTNCLTNKLDSDKNKASNNNPILNFNPNFIISKIIDNLKEKNEFFEINNSFIYFKYIIGEGSYGMVGFGIKLDDNTPIAVKIQKNTNKEDVLKIEYDILKKFPEYYPFPKAFYHESNNLGNILVESLAGPSLAKLYEFCDYDFDVVTICYIGIDLITSIELLHKTGYIHDDLKPDNIAILLKDIKSHNNDICCIPLDFGKVKKYTKVKNKIKKTTGKINGRGNYKFSSLNALYNGEANPKDDLESIVYILLFFYNNFLPWSNYAKVDKKEYKQFVLKEKKKFNIKKYCKNDFLELIDLFEDIKKINTQNIDYSKYIKILLKCIERNDTLNDKNQKFKWENKFVDVMKDFYLNKNFQNLNDLIKILFEGYPEQLAFAFISQYYI